MIKYTPQTPPEDNINVLKENPLLELSKLLGGVIGVTVILYLALGFFTELLMPLIPPRVEQGLEPIARSFIRKYEAAPEHQARVQAVLAQLSQHYPQIPYPLHVHVQKSSTFNAVTLPAGHIVIFTGLLETIKDENELAFVLAHELGHIHNRDHLKSMGRGILFLLTSTAILGSDNTISQVISKSVEITDRQFSQKQEQDADRFALHLLSASYQHVGGSLSFFRRLSQREGTSGLAMLSTHPPTRERLKAMQRLITQEKLAL